MALPRFIEIDGREPRSRPTIAVTIASNTISCQGKAAEAAAYLSACLPATPAPNTRCNLKTQKPSKINCLLSQFLGNPRWRSA
jgi:hypothetical protein